jgi:hypothetical protein
MDGARHKRRRRRCVSRTRARFTSVVLGVTAAAQVAEYAMHLLFGIDTGTAREPPCATRLIDTS